MPKEVCHAPGAKLHPHSPRPTPPVTAPRRNVYEKKEAMMFDCNHLTFDCKQNEPISYQDMSSISTDILKGTLTINQIKDAQIADPFCSRIIDKVHKLKHYKMIKVEA